MNTTAKTTAAAGNSAYETSQRSSAPSFVPNCPVLHQRFLSKGFVMILPNVYQKGTIVRRVLPSQ